VNFPVGSASTFLHVVSTFIFTVQRVRKDKGHTVSQCSATWLALTIVSGMPRRYLWTSGDVNGMPTTLVKFPAKVVHGAVAFTRARTVNSKQSRAAIERRQRR
jgi:hypothetical protein